MITWERFVKTEINGIVIKEVELSNGNRLFHVLTGQLGIITAIAKSGSFKKNNKFSSIHVLMYCRFVLFKRKEYYHIDEFDILNVFWEIKDDLKLLAICQYFCELCITLSPDSSVSEDFLKLFLNSIFCISKSIKDIRLIKMVFEMKSMSLCGYMPDLVCCCKCGKYDSNVMSFLLYDGKIICNNCYSDSKYVLKVQITKGMLYALRHIVYSSIEKIFSFELSDKAIKVLSDLSENYVKYHLDTDFKSLEFYNCL